MEEKGHNRSWLEISWPWIHFEKQLCWWTAVVKAGRQTNLTFQQVGVCVLRMCKWECHGLARTAQSGSKWCPLDKAGVCPEYPGLRVGPINQPQCWNHRHEHPPKRYCTLIPLMNSIPILWVRLPRSMTKWNLGHWSHFGTQRPPILLIWNTERTEPQPPPPIPLHPDIHCYCPGCRYQRTCPEVTYLFPYRWGTDAIGETIKPGSRTATCILSTCQKQA